MTTALASGGRGIAAIAAALVVAMTASGVLVVDGVEPSALAPPIALLLVIVALLLVISSHHRSSREWLFSTSFWLAVTVGFYVVLKAVAMIVSGDADIIVAPLGGTAVFLGGYAISALAHRNYQPAVALRSARYHLSPGGIWIVAALYLVFQIFGLALSAWSGGSTVLEIANATQNGGASYLFRIPLLANAFYLMLLSTAYRERRHIWLALAATLVSLGIAVVSSSRYSIIIVILLNLYFYNRYIKALSLIWLAVLAPPLVFVVVLFGYVRNIGIGDLGVLIDALSYFQGHGSTIIELFMARLDMLPQMSKGFAIYAAGTAPHLDGLSYINAFLHAIPRSVWPDKAPLTAAVLTSITAPGAFADGVLLYPSIVIEGLFNFGWPGIALSGFGVGLLARGFDALLNSGSIVPTTWALLSFTFPMGLFNEGFHSNFTGGILYVTVLYGGAIGLLRLTRALVR